MPSRLKARSAAADVAGKNGYSLISRDKFQQLYAALVKYELLGERLEGDPVDRGAEAMSLHAGTVGVTLDLEREDTVVLASGTFAASFVRGVPARARLQDCGTVGVAGNGARHASVTVLATAAGAQAALAAGAALANKMAKNRGIAVALMESGMTALKTSMEALELASSHKLPILFVTQARTDRRHEKVLEKIGRLFPVIAVDAYDAVAVYRVAQESIARARDGSPTLIACATSDANGNRTSAVTNMEQYLGGRELFEDRWKEEAMAEFDREMKASCLPTSDTLA